MSRNLWILLGLGATCAQLAMAAPVSINYPPSRLTYMDNDSKMVIDIKRTDLPQQFSLSVLDQNFQPVLTLEKLTCDSAMLDEKVVRCVDAQKNVVFQVRGKQTRKSVIMFLSSGESTSGDPESGEILEGTWATYEPACDPTAISPELKKAAKLVKLNGRYCQALSPLEIAQATK
jgi:hypothetical protein